MPWWLNMEVDNNGTLDFVFDSCSNWQCVIVDCKGERANDLAEITTRGGSPASTLQIHSLHHAATSPPLHAIIGAKIICSTFSQLISANNFDIETKHSCAPIWLIQIWNESCITSVRQHCHTATQWLLPNKRTPQTCFEYTTFPRYKQITCRSKAQAINHKKLNTQHEKDFL